MDKEMISKYRAYVASLMGRRDFSDVIHAFAVPALCDEVERLQEEVEKVKAVVEAAKRWEYERKFPCVNMDTINNLESAIRALNTGASPRPVVLSREDAQKVEDVLTLIQEKLK